MPEQSDNTNPYFVQSFCTDTALYPDGVLQTDKWMQLPAFLRRSTKIAPMQSPLEIEMKLSHHLVKRKKSLSPKTNRRMIVEDGYDPSYITFRNLQNKYRTCRDSSEACVIDTRGIQSIYLCYYKKDNSIYECLYVGNPHIRNKRILAGDARDILTNDEPIQSQLELPFDSPHVIWCTGFERYE